MTVRKQRVWSPVAKGSSKRGKENGKMREDSSTKRVVCIFDDDMVSRVRERALREKTSFAYQVRLLVEWGLEAE